MYNVKSVIKLILKPIMAHMIELNPVETLKCDVSPMEALKLIYTSSKVSTATTVHENILTVVCWGKWNINQPIDQEKITLDNQNLNGKM